MIDDFKQRNSDGPQAVGVMGMREPPGRLGSIVRRLKKTPPAPPPLAERTAPASGDGTE